MATREELEAMARAAAEEHGVDPDIYVRQIQQESGFNPKAVSSAGAKGIAQFMDPTARSLGVDPWDVKSALYGGARLMRENLDMFSGDYEKALGAYNTGPNNIKKGTWPKETLDYVERILGKKKGQMSVLFPGRMMDPTVGAMDDTRSSRLAYEAAADDLATARRESIDLPRAEVMRERGPVELGLPALFANMATAISNNPLYQQGFMGQMGMEDEERRSARAENRQIGRQEILMQREQNLQSMIEKMEFARQRLERDEHFEDALKLQGQQAKLQRELADMEERRAVRVAKITADSRLHSAAMRLGYQFKEDENGDLVMVGGIKPGVSYKREDRLNAIRLVNSDLASSKTSDKQRADLRQNRLDLILTADDGDTSWTGMYARMARELNDPDLMARLAPAIAAQYAGQVPGAAEAYQAYQDAAPMGQFPSGGEKAGLRQNLREYGVTEGPQGGTYPAEGVPREEVPAAPAGPRAPLIPEGAGDIGEEFARGEEIARENLMKRFPSFYAEKKAKPKAEGAKKAPEQPRGETIRQKLQTMGGQGMAEVGVEEAQNEVNALENLIKRFPALFAGSDASDKLAQAYKKLAKAKKNLETIRLKGETPKKTE